MRKRSAALPQKLKSENATWSGVSLSSFCVLLFAFIVASGCMPKEPPTTRPTGYFGPTKTLPEVIAAVNANNQRIPTLWTRFDYEAWLRDPETKKEEHLVGENSKIQYRSPGEFRLRADNEALGNLLDLGINKERYWLVAFPPGPDTMWWGHVKSDDSGVDSRIPIPPQGMLQVMGISTLNIDLLAEPAPVLRFNNDAKVYMIVWSRRIGDRYVAEREVWYQMDGYLPVKVLLFDRNGRVVLRADLSNHKPITTESGPGPKIATTYRLFFPENGSRMNLDLESPRLRRGDQPNDDSFRSLKVVPVAKEIQLDAQK